MSAAKWPQNVEESASNLDDLRRSYNNRRARGVEASRSATDRREKRKIMSGPIVRTGTTPKYGESWDRIFGGKAAKAAGTKAAAKPKAKAAAAKAVVAKATRAKSTTAKAAVGAKKSKKG